MGLINIYMRLNLHYGAQAVFEFGNNDRRAAPMCALAALVPGT